MKITITKTITYEITDCAKWTETVGETIRIRSQRKLSTSGLRKCFSCGKVFDENEMPYIAFVKGYKNSFICEKCSKKVKENV